MVLLLRLAFRVGGSGRFFLVVVAVVELERPGSLVERLIGRRAKLEASGEICVIGLGIAVVVVVVVLVVVDGVGSKLKVIFVNIWSMIGSTVMDLVVSVCKE